MQFVLATITKLKNDSLSRNAFFLMLSTFIMAGIGFFFWTICARLFTTEQIGLATTLISITSLITGFSLLGFNVALVRFLPTTKDKNSFINSAIGSVSLAAIVITIIFLIGLPIFSPKLVYLQKYPAFELSLIVFMVIATINSLTDSIFLSYRRAEFTLIINTVMSLVKLVLPFVFLSMGAYGIFYAFMSSIQIAFLLSIISLTIFFGFRFFPIIKIQDLKKVWKFTTGNYISSLLGMLPSTIAPILITNTLGPTATAYYYMPNMILQMLLAVPRSTSASFFSEGSNNSQTPLRFLFLKSLFTTYAILIPLTIILILSGKYILLVFGKNYSIEGYPYLVSVLLSLLISAPIQLISQVLNIKHEVKKLMFFNLFTSITSIGVLVLFINQGLFGIGISTIINSSISLIIGIILFYKTIFNKNQFTLTRE